MAAPVKPRRYDSPRRRAQAAQTRREILDAAQRLFARDGYAATSIAQIASDAQVALNTVYAVFGTKRGVLLALWNLGIRGDEEPIPVARRPWFLEMASEPDPERQLRLVARNSRIVKARASELMEIVRAAAPVDPEIAALWSRLQNEFHANQRSIIEILHHKRALPIGLDVDRATDILWTLNSPSLYRMLVHDRRWAPHQYEQWLGDTLCSQLLRDQ